MITENDILLPNNTKTSGIIKVATAKKVAAPESNNNTEKTSAPIDDIQKTDNDILASKPKKVIPTTASKPEGEAVTTNKEAAQKEELNSLLETQPDMDLLLRMEESKKNTEAEKSSEATDKSTPASKAKKSPRAKSTGAGKGKRKLTKEEKERIDAMVKADSKKMKKYIIIGNAVLLSIIIISYLIFS